MACPLDYGHVAAARCGTPFPCVRPDRRLVLGGPGLPELGGAQRWGQCPPRLSPHRADDGTGIQLSARTTPPKSSLRSQKGVFYWVCFLGLGVGGVNSLWDGLAAPGTSLAARIGNAGKGKMFSFLKLNFLKPMQRKIEEYQTRGGGRTRELCACSGRSCGAQVGRQPMAQRWDGWRAGDGEPPHKASGARPWSGWPWKPLGNPSAQLPKPFGITGARQRVAGVTGGGGSGRETPSPRPARADLCLCPAWSC